MRITTKTAETIEGVFDKWMKIGVPISIEGNDLVINPRYFSALLKINESEDMSYFDGIAVNNLPDVDHNSCLRLEGYIGKDEKGSGIAVIGFDGLPDNLPLLEKRVDDHMDEILKSGGLRYLVGLGESIKTKKPSNLRLNGYSDPVKFRQKKIGKRLRVKDFEKEVLQYVPDFKNLEGIERVATTICCEREESLFLDTEGSRIFQNSDYLQIVYILQGKDQSDKTFNLVSNMHFVGRDGFDPKILKRKLEKLVGSYEDRRFAERIDSGSYPIIFDGAAVATFFHEALAAHLLSGKYVTDGNSTLFSESRLNKQILPQGINIIDDPSLEKGLGSYLYDEEGVKAEPITLVEDGILRNYLLDKSSAAELSKLIGEEVKSNGRARSQWAINEENAIISEPRVSNLLIDCDNLHEEDDIFTLLVGMVDHYEKDFGLYIEGAAGEVDVVNGYFKLKPIRAWKVDLEGNKQMVKDIQIVGNPDEFFQKIYAAGLPNRTSYGMCGSDSGFVPTQQRAPAMLMSEISVVTERKDYSTDRLDKGMK